MYIHQETHTMQQIILRSFIKEIQRKHVTFHEISRNVLIDEFTREFLNETLLLLLLIFSMKPSKTNIIPNKTREARKLVTSSAIPFVTIELLQFTEYQFSIRSIVPTFS